MLIGTDGGLPHQIIIDIIPHISLGTEFSKDSRHMESSEPVGNGSAPTWYRQHPMKSQGAAFFEAFLASRYSLSFFGSPRFFAALLLAFESDFAESG
jgi:hypothetical protein